MTLNVVEEFDEDLPAVGESTEDDPLPVGFWTMIHYLMKQNGYDWHEEIDACTKAIENRFRSLVKFHGEEVAQAELESVIADLQAVEISSR